MALFASWPTVSAGLPREREILGPSKLGKGAWPDGIAFDCYGNLSRGIGLLRQAVRPHVQGRLRVLLDKGDPRKVNALEEQFLSNHVTEDVLFATGQGLAPWMASVTFGRSDLRTASEYRLFSRP